MDLARTYLLEASSVTVNARPSEKLKSELGNEESQRVSERKKSLGKKGLKELKLRVDNAIDHNDVMKSHVFNN